MPKKKIMQSLTIKELSGVDFPAQTGARALLMKRRVDDPETKKTVDDLSATEIADLIKRGAAVLTTATDGHTHLVMLEDFDGNKVVSGTTTWQDEHTHPWIELEDGTILIGEVDDHTHEPDRKSKLAGDTTMTDEQKAALEKAEQERDAANERAERAEKIAKFNDATKAYFETLDKAGQDAFLEKSEDDQEADVSAYTKAQDDENPVVYKDGLGNEYRKNDDARIVAMAKQGDKDREDLKKAREAADKAALEKRANELCPNLANNVAALKAAEAIEDEDERDAAIKGLTAASEALSPAFKSLGTGISPTAPEGSPEDQLEKLAEDMAKKENITHAQAYAKVLETPEGEALYTKHKAQSQPN